MSWQYFYSTAKISNQWHTLYAATEEDYVFVEQLFQEATRTVGNKNMQRIFDYMAPKLRERGLNPRFWISWVFRKRMI